MQSLYSNGFEHIYDAMYRTFIDYQDEYDFYSSIIKEYKKDDLLEIGCGTGNLATHFINSSIHYTGLDLSEDMVKLSKTKNPKGRFIQGDVTDFIVKKSVGSVIISGRTTSYLTSNKKVNSALKSIYKSLESNGILCFDFIDANRFFLEIKGGKSITHNANYKEILYSRESYMKPILNEENFMFQWDAKYYRHDSSQKTRITDDSSIVRAFTKNEWELFLFQNNFKLLKFIDRKSYAFDTYVVLAQKI